MGRISISNIQPGCAKFGKLVYFVDSKTISHRTFDHHKCLKCKSRHKNGEIIKLFLKECMVYIYPNAE